MHVIVATDGSRASLVGARQFKWIADSREITDITVVAVVSPCPSPTNWDRTSTPISPT